MSGIAALWAGSQALGKIKMLAIAAAGAAVLTTIGLLLWQNHSLRNDNKILAANNGMLEVAIDQQRETVDRAVEITEEWETHLIDFQRQLDELARVQRAATAETRRLNDVFAKHDLERLSLAKPGLVERVINDGTDRIFGLFEYETGGDTNDASGSEDAGESAGAAESSTD